MPLYPNNETHTLDVQLFRAPTADYRGAPFWSWNTALDREQLLRQYTVLHQMGMGGFHIHSRTGLATPYLGDAFMGHVRALVEQAAQDGQHAWLYDEDRWPSGFAGGLVTQEPQYRAKHLLFTTTPYNGSAEPPNLISGAKAGRFENGTLLARYQVVLADGVLAHYQRLADDAPADGHVWYAYLESAVPSPWWNNQTYVDTLDPAAIQRFIEVTHECYAAAVGEFFGTTIPAIFTDEPQFVHKILPQWAEATSDLFLPWTTTFGARYQAVYASDPLDTLPEVFWQLPNGAASQARYRYHDQIAECFASAFADTLGTWCADHGLLLTGHMMEEPTLASQTAALGEAMRSYRSFTLPGIDMLCDRHEYTTAKQAQSAAHQFDRPGVLSELYGVTNWDFPFAGHKAQGDWQAALGVTVRVHHLTWVSMAGEAKRDYPASIGEQSPWWREYRLVEDYFARVNTALTRGKALVRVGVIHPIESYWLCYGPRNQTGREQAEREQQFADLTNWLLFGLIDFDFIAESLFADLCPNPGATPLAVGASRYDVVIVPPMRTMRATTLARLTAFRAAGGTVIFAGDVPTLVDALPSPAVVEFAAAAQQIAFTRGQLLAALEPVREIAVYQANGAEATTLLHQFRQDGEQRLVFVCNTNHERGLDAALIVLHGTWRVTHLDAHTGDTSDRAASYDGTTTTLTADLAAHGSLLLQLTPGRGADVQPQPRGRWQEIARLSDLVPITLSEPNVLLLDQAAYQLDDGPWQPVEEILRLDTTLRQQLGWPLRMDALAQPWTTAFPIPTHTLRLKCSITSTVAVSAPQLALEAATHALITLDGKAVSSVVTGWWVDQAIQTVALPDLAAGTHELVIAMPYGPQTNPEWCYLLGDFGVAVRGRHSQIIAPVRELAWGDWTRQGLPFYAGNVTYHCLFPAVDAPIRLHVPQFTAPLLTVDRAGQRLGAIAFAPFQLDIAAGAASNTLDITAFGNRVNAFGALHNVDPHVTWYGPDAWRSVGANWAYEYHLRPMGVLTAPLVLSTQKQTRS